MPELPDVGAVLARHGLAPGPDGYPLAGLEALAEARGWRFGVEPATRPTRWTRYRAVVWRTGDPRDPDPRTFTARGRGTSEEVALAQALARALERWPGGGIPPARER